MSITSPRIFTAIKLSKDEKCIFNYDSSNSILIKLRFHLPQSFLSFIQLLPRMILILPL